MQSDWIDDVAPGKDLRRRIVEVDAERVRRYLLAVGSENSWYTEGSPLGYPVAPATLLALEPFEFTAYRLQHRSSPVNEALEWHGSNAVRVGERLELGAKVVERFVRGTRERVVFEMIATTDNGGIATHARATVSYPVADQVPAQRATSVKADEVPVGEALTPFTRTIDLAMTRALFHQKENWHTNAAAARERGHDRVVVGGPHLLCLMSECLTGELGVVWLLSGHLAARFRRPVYVGDAITVLPFVQPAPLQAVPDGMSLIVRCENQHGELVASADAYVRGVPGGRASV